MSKSAHGQPDTRALDASVYLRRAGNCKHALRECRSAPAEDSDPYSGQSVKLLGFLSPRETMESTRRTVAELVLGRAKGPTVCFMVRTRE